MSSVDEFPGSARRGRFRLRITSEHRDLTTFALWCSVTFVQFPRDELLLYSLALYYMWAIWRDQSKIAPLLASSWVVLLFPVWCLLSPLLAVDPMSALKQSLYLILTLMICFQVAATVSPRRILLAVLIAGGVIGTINFLYAYGTGDVRTGIFAQKNAMGKNMALLWVIGIAAVMDREFSRKVRLAGGALAVVSAWMAVQSQSATAVMLVLGTGVLVVAGSIFLLGGVLRSSRIALLCFCLAASFGVAAIVVPNLQADPVDMVLKAFGKDSTLTGRTVLWKYAEDQIAERPVLGVGANGFWNYHASPIVRKIYHDYHMGAYARFNFHNSYYEITVHQGFIGLGFMVAAILWAMHRVTRGVLVIATMPMIYFFTHALTVLSRTLTESDFLQPFVLTHMILWIGAISVGKALQDRAKEARQGRIG